MKGKGPLSILMTLTLAAAIVVAGCTAPPATTQPTSAPVPATAVPPQPTQAPVKLTFWSWMIGDADKAIQNEMVAAFMKEHPNIVVDLQYIDYGAYWDKLLTSVAGDTGPDIASLEPMRLPGYASKGALLDLTDRLNAWGQKDDFFKGLWVSNTWENKIYGLPWHASDFILYYNTDLLKAAGFDGPPKTWQELTDMAVATSKNTTDPQTGVYGYVPDLTSPAGVMFNWLPYLWSAGGDLLAPDGRSTAINSPQGVESLGLFADLYQKGTIPNSALTGTWEDIQGLWVSGRAALYVSGPHLIALTKNEAPNVHFNTALLPQKNGPAAFHTGGNLVILAKSKHPDEAWQLLQYLTDAQAQRRYAEANNGVWMSSLAVRKSSYSDDFYQKFPEIQAFSSALEYAQISVTPQLSEIMKPIGDEVQMATLGKTTPQDALKAAAEQADAILANEP